MHSIEEMKNIVSQNLQRFSDCEDGYEEYDAFYTEVLITDAMKVSEFMELEDVTFEEVSSYVCTDNYTLDSLISETVNYKGEGEGYVIVDDKCNLRRFHGKYMQ